VITIDGSLGEGGGQILRTSLALSCITRIPLRLHRIRAKRSRPGLRPQHLVCVRAAAQISGARVEGDRVGSCELLFRPKKVRSGDFGFQIGTAGSTTLVLQTVLLPLALCGDRRSTVRIGGGTHNDKAPPVDYLQRAWLPLLNRMGLRVELSLERPGFYPRGGGSIVARIFPGKLGRLDLPKRGQQQALRGLVVQCGLGAEVGERALDALGQTLTLSDTELRQFQGPPGLAVMVEAEHRCVSELFSGLADRGRKIDEAAVEAARLAHAWLDQPAPVGKHLADQLLLPLALSPGGSFTTVKPSPHTTTNIQVIQRFLDCEVQLEERQRTWECLVTPA